MVPSLSLLPEFLDRFSNFLHPLLTGVTIGFIVKCAGVSGYSHQKWSSWGPVDEDMGVLESALSATLPAPDL